MNMQLHMGIWNPGKLPSPRISLVQKLELHLQSPLVHESPRTHTLTRVVGAGVHGVLMWVYGTQKRALGALCELLESLSKLALGYSPPRTDKWDHEPSLIGGSQITMIN